jgi:SAM-dependent MidA family methyltransferase
MTAIDLVEQGSFLLGLIEGLDFSDSKRRNALKTLVWPGGMGTTFKVLILGKNVGAPALRGSSFLKRSR